MEKRSTVCTLESVILKQIKQYRWIAEDLVRLQVEFGDGHPQQDGTEGEEGQDDSFVKAQPAAAETWAAFAGRTKKGFFSAAHLNMMLGRRSRCQTRE